MTAIALTQHSLRTTKRVLAPNFPDCGSSHLSEALAAGLGFRTQASLLARIKETGEIDPDYALLNEEAFASRLNALTGTSIGDIKVVTDEFARQHHEPGSGIFRTRSARWDAVKYQSKRDRGWRNLLVAGINAGIAQRLFTILPGDNRWPGADAHGGRGIGRTYVYHFAIENIPAIASVSDAGWDELSIHVALWPTSDADRWIRCTNAGLMAGEACATSWLERRSGAWLQVATDRFFVCRKKRLDIVAALEVSPICFGERGSFCF
ncbi:hypothetical protein [Methylorubrum populi]|uniref:hypothetical protein n=1 Tax=Methylorubrum populi TaxID=223967 RepID=UPI003F65C9AA